MTSRASVAIDRTSLSEDPIVIADDSADYRLTEDGVGYVVQTVRVTTTQDSAHVDGSAVIGYAREATALPLEFDILGTSSADVAAKIAVLEEALYRLGYPVTRTVGGVAKTWAAGPCALVPKRPSVDSGDLAAHIETFTISIPFYNPNGA